MKGFALVPILLCLINGNFARKLGRSDSVWLNVPQIPEINVDWMKSVQEWHVPVWSEFYKTKTASAFLGKTFEEVTEDDLAAPACITFRPPSLVAAFGQLATFNIESSGTSIKFSAPNENAEGGEMKFVLTDNASFIVGLTTWDNGEKAWVVLSTEKVFPEYFTNELLDFVESQDFDPLSTVYEDYSKC